MTDGHLLLHLHLEEMLEEGMTLEENINLADASTEKLMMGLLRRLLHERKERRAVVSSSSDGAACDQQLIDAATAAADNKKKAAAAAARKERRRKQKQNRRRRNQTAAKHEKTNLIPMSWRRGGIIILLAMMIAFGSSMALNSPFSLIRQSDASGEGENSPTLPPSASSSLRKEQHLLSNFDNAASPEIIRSPLAVVVPPPIFSPAAASNHRMKSDVLRSIACVDTPNWVDLVGDGCDDYEEYDSCSGASTAAGDMGPATENCCYCSIIPATNSPTISISPTKSATPSTSPTITSSPSFSTSQTQFCLDMPNWKDKEGNGCDYYEEYEWRCSYADTDNRAGDMGPATENCCFCLGGIRTVSQNILCFKFD